MTARGLRGCSPPSLPPICGQPGPRPTASPFPGRAAKQLINGVRKELTGMHLGSARRLLGAVALLFALAPGRCWAQSPTPAEQAFADEVFTRTNAQRAQFSALTPVQRLAFVNQVFVGVPPDP